VITQSHQRRDGEFRTEVTLNRPGVVLLKTSYDPSWRAFVDGVEQPVAFMAPSLVGVEVPAGNHTVQFTYKPYSLYPLWFVVAASTLVGLWLIDRRRRVEHARSDLAVAAAEQP